MESFPLADKIRSFETDSLKALSSSLKRQTYPGYPSFDQRLWIEAVYDWFEPLELPLGPWETSDGEVPKIADQNSFKEQALRLDAYGRPLHPWFDEMATDPNIGVVTGRGFYFHWGPNQTVDPIIVRNDLTSTQVLLVKRRDTGAWALPGGFVDTGEDELTAALRETREETGLDIANMIMNIKTIYSGPVADPRITANAWANTTAIRFDLPDKLPADFHKRQWAGGDDAVLAKWQPVSNLNEELFGSHRLLVNLALT